MLKKYVLKLLFRISLLVFVVYLYIFKRDLLSITGSYHIGGIRPLHVIWIILMLEMIIQIRPTSKITMGCLKQFWDKYSEPSEPYNRLKLYENVQKMNISALKVLLSWLLFNALIGIVYLSGMIGETELILIMMFYYVSDLICVIIWCPFQSFIMKNRCCVNCRIFNWGHFMMYTPMLFVRSFFSWSLFFMSILVLIRWEITYLKYPERFWDGSNTAIRCESCSDNLCYIKNGLKSRWKKEFKGSR